MGLWKRGETSLLLPATSCSAGRRFVGIAARANWIPAARRARHTAGPNGLGIPVMP